MVTNEMAIVFVEVDRNHDDWPDEMAIELIERVKTLKSLRIKANVQIFIRVRSDRT